MNGRTLAGWLAGWFWKMEWLERMGAHGAHITPKQTRQPPFLFHNSTWRQNCRQRRGEPTSLGGPRQTTPERPDRRNGGEFRTNGTFQRGRSEPPAMSAAPGRKTVWHHLPVQYLRKRVMTRLSTTNYCSRGHCGWICVCVWSGGCGLGLRWGLGWSK